MAQGDLVIFDEAKKAFFDGTHDLDTHTFRCALVNNATVPTTGDTTPVLGDYTELAAGGNYAAGGITLVAVLSEVGGTVTYDFTTNPLWLQDAANPVNAYWAIIYNDTNAGKEAIGFVDLGGVFDMTTGDLAVNWNASGFFTLV